jgi:outer membrane protein assembly factor BamB
LGSACGSTGQSPGGSGASGLGALAPTKFLVQTNWTEFGFVLQGWRWNPYENTVGASTAPKLSKRWSVAIGTVVDSSPALTNGMAYVGSDDGNVYALNASTGARRWRFACGGEVGSSPAVADGLV